MTVDIVTLLLHRRVMLVAEWSYDGAKKIISLQMGEEAAPKTKEGASKKEDFNGIQPFSP